MYSSTFLVFIPRKFDIEDFINSDDEEYSNELIREFNLFKQDGYLIESDHMFEDLLNIFREGNLIISERMGIGCSDLNGDTIICIKSVDLDKLIEVKNQYEN